MLEEIKAEQKRLRKEARSDLTGDTKVKAMLLTTLIGELEGLAKKKELDDSLIQQVIKKFLKNNKETQMHTTDLGIAKNIVLENQVLESFLPKQLSESELEDAVGKILEAVHDTPDLANMGYVMGQLNAQYNGQYDGKMASTIVRNALGGK